MAAVAASTTGVRRALGQAGSSGGAPAILVMGARSVTTASSSSSSSLGAARLLMRRPAPGTATRLRVAAGTTTTERQLLGLAARLLAGNANCLLKRSYRGHAADWCVPVAAEAFRVLCASADRAQRQVRRSLARRLGRFLRALWRACEVSLVLSPLLVTFPFVYLTGRLLPWVRRKWWAYALWSIEALGPCMVKFMQWASTRRDILAPEVCDILEPIQWQTRPHTWRETAESLRTLRDDWERVLEVDQHSIMLGSGSVAQVYRGRAHVPPAAGADDATAPPLAREVAVKVIHPGVKRQIELDLDLMRFGAWLVELSGHLQWWSVREFVEEFAVIMQGQLDLRAEARALDRFRANFDGQREIHFPKPLWPLVNEFVLVEDFVGGVPISHILKDPAYPEAERKRIARTGLSAFLKMVFLDNFVHGDLHPGNIFVREDPQGRKRSHLTFIDAGIVTELTAKDRRNFIDLFYAIARGHGEEAGRLMIERARDHACSDPAGFSQGISRIVDEAVGNHLQLGKIRVGFLIQKVLALCLQYQVKLESNFAAILLAIGVLEGVGRSLDPELDILTASTPFIVKSQILHRTEWKEQERQEREAAAAAAATAAAAAAAAAASEKKP